MAVDYLSIAPSKRQGWSVPLLDMPSVAAAANQAQGKLTTYTMQAWFPSRAPPGMYTWPVTCAGPPPVTGPNGETVTTGTVSVLESL